MLRWLSGALHRHPGVRLTLLLVAPMLVLVVVYLGALFVLLLSAFWSTDVFTGNVVRSFTLDNFREVVSNDTYRAVTLRTIGVAVASLDRIDRMAAFMEDLGVRHAGYGVKLAHYATVEQALLWTLRMCLGAGFTSDVRQAWTEIYGLLAKAMQRYVAGDDDAKAAALANAPPGGLWSRRRTFGSRRPRGLCR